MLFYACISANINKPIQNQGTQSLHSVNYPNSYTQLSLGFKALRKQKIAINACSLQPILLSLTY